jgi:hypothetical protein
MELAERIQRGRRAIALAKKRSLDTAEWERYLSSLFEDAGREPVLEAGLHPWILWEFRRVCIPEWREILRNSIAMGDRRREHYARWMLKEILLDPDYQEEES